MNKASVSRPFRRPFDISTPMSRLDFWIFYVGYIAFSCLTVVILSRITALQNVSENPSLAILIAVSGSLWMLYLIATLLSAMARRMRDSGYHRISILLAIVFFGSLAVSLVSDVSLSSGDSSSPSIEISYSNLTIAIFAAFALSFFHIFLGLTRKSKTNIDVSEEKSTSEVPN